MSTARYDWWPVAVRAVRVYPARKESYRELHRQSITADLSGMPRGGGGGRTVEMIATRQLPPAQQREYDAVTAAIKQTRAMPGGETRLKIIKAMYWSGGKVRITDAIPMAYVSETTGRRYHREFILLVGRNLGYIGENGR